MTIEISESKINRRTYIRLINIKAVPHVDGMTFVNVISKVNMWMS